MSRRLPEAPNTFMSALDRHLGTYAVRVYSTVGDIGDDSYACTERIDSESARILTAAIRRGWREQQNAVRKVQELRPDLPSEQIDHYMQTLAAGRLPDWVKPEFWSDALDQILRAGVREGPGGERRAVNKVLRMHRELRPEAAWSRVRHLRRQQRQHGSGGSRSRWTPDLDRTLIEHAASDGLGAALVHMATVSGYPQDAIRRRARRLGLAVPTRPKPRNWTNAEIKFLVESVQHMAVPVLAKELCRSEKAIWRKAAELGLSAKCLEGSTTKEVMRNLHVSWQRLRQWVEAGWIKVGRNRRITERSLRSFLREHADELDLNRLDDEAREWLREFGFDAGAGRAARSAGHSG